MQKYGVGNFSFSVLEETQDAEAREQYYIEKFDTFKQGYNATLGGDGVKRLDYEKIKNFYLEHRDWSFYQIANELHIDRNSITAVLKHYNIQQIPDDQVIIDYYLNNPVTQKEVAEYFYISPIYVNRLMQKYNIGDKRKHYKTQEEQEEFEKQIITRFLEKPYISQEKLAKEFGISFTSMQRILKKHQVTREGRASSKGYTKSTQPVYQYDLQGNLIAEYESMGAAAKAMGRTDSSNISACCRGVQLTAYGYRWSREKIVKEDN